MFSGFILERTGNSSISSNEASVRFDDATKAQLYSSVVGIYFDKHQYTPGYFSKSIFRVSTKEYSWGNDYYFGHAQITIDYSKASDEFYCVEWFDRRYFVSEDGISDIIGRCVKVISPSFREVALENDIETNWNNYDHYRNKFMSPNQAYAYFSTYPIDLIKCMANNDYKALQEIVDRKKGLDVQLVVGNYKKTEHLGFENIIEPVISTKARRIEILEDIFNSPQYLLFVQPKEFKIAINLFLANDIKEIFEKYGECVIFEYINERDGVLTIILKNIKGNWRIIAFRDEGTYSAEDEAHTD